MYSDALHNNRCLKYFYLSIFNSNSSICFLSVKCCIQSVCFKLKPLYKHYTKYVREFKDKIFDISSFIFKKSCHEYQIKGF